jgi:hypothetical protein
MADRVSTKAVAVRRARDNQRSNAIVGWALLIAVVLFILFCIIFKSQTSSWFNGGQQQASTMALSSDVVPSAGAPLPTYHPECGLNQQRHICRQPNPLPCAQGDGWDNGMAIPDLNLYPAGIWTATAYNSGAWSPSTCAEQPQSCPPTCTL